MIQEFVDRFMAAKHKLRKRMIDTPPFDYGALVKMVVETITSDAYSDIDPERIHEINDGCYQGTLVYVIACKGYQPSTYWYLRVYYGSCSGCDTLEAIQTMVWRASAPVEKKEQIDAYMTLALHVVQRLKKMGGDAV